MYKNKIFDYAEQLLAEGEARGEARGEVKGEENMLRRAIKNNVPFTVLEAMAAGANISQERLKQLIDEVEKTVIA